MGAPREDFRTGPSEPQRTGATTAIVTVIGERLLGADTRAPHLGFLNRQGDFRRPGPSLFVGVGTVLFQAGAC